MIHAYDKNYLDLAMSHLGEMLDFATYDLKYPLDDFWGKFLSSNESRRFERGESSILAGKSGVEIAYDVIMDELRTIKPRFVKNRSKEYWTGWALAYFQWESGLSFLKITETIPIVEISNMYHPYHEMDIRQFCDSMKEIYHARNPLTELKKRRMKLRLSQKSLSEISGVPLRTLQQYEQRQKDINKAQANYIIALAKALYCETFDLMEY